MQAWYMGCCPTLPMSRSGFESRRLLQFKVFMKIHEAKGVEQLDEITFKQAVAAAGVGASLMGAPKYAVAPESPPRQYSMIQPQQTKQLKVQLSPKEQKVVHQISTRYNTDPTFASEVLELAKKYEKPNFPTAHDILAIIATESEFDPDAVSGLHTDPAIGLMQIRPNVWNLNPEDLKDPEFAIKTGAAILNKYYHDLGGDKKKTIQAYNVGLTNVKKGKYNHHYLHKVIQHLKNISPLK